ncbi:WD40 repeat domain-containing protein [Paenibacillus sp. 1011MAR3C5]|uniref:WD40 repeat domain-containing protein n=1 Tax=Paenibacillus sp. 1011MAR3C5 TaxID=1675787 RepID=UPI0011C35B6F|nr:WD40 repeat domain-containing protein [Paenibacillus sp. 1011MAR3C5]
MNAKRMPWPAWIAGAVLLLLLSGCAGGLRTETILIPDQPETVPDTGSGHAFDVNTIYRLPGMEEFNVSSWRWMASDMLARLSWGRGGWESIDRYASPYEKPEKLLKLEGYPLEFSDVSPNGRYFAHLAPGNGDQHHSTLTLVSIPEGVKTEVNSPYLLPRSAARELTWSSNSRFVSSFYMDEQGGIGIAVYDAELGELITYMMPDQNKSSLLHSVKLSAEGDGAIVVRSEPGKLTSFVLGLWKDGRFVSEYEHSLHENGGVEWLDPNRVVFAGTDGTLFVYDRRNGDLSVLMDQSGAFALSADRQYIAYSTDEATIDVAKLQGNNLLNKTTVYHGLIADELAWSPDKSALLVQGRKPYEAPSVVAPAVAAEEPLPAPSQRDLFGQQAIIIAFKSNK